jgi:proprotein convertase subtilisin/kexin type 5
MCYMHQRGMSCRIVSFILFSYPFNATACASCALACASCIGPGSLAPDCTSCNAQGYIDPGSGVCTICYGTCLTCTGVLQNQCTSCQYGSFLSSNRCISSCPTTFYGSEMLRACIACNSPCATCDGSTANHCISCLTGFYLY